MSEFNQEAQSSSFQSANLNDFAKPAKPDNYLVIAIVGTVIGLCSCLPFIIGVIAIIFATQVDSKYNAGDYAGAESSSNTAKILSYIALGLSILGIIANILYYVFVGAAVFQQYQSGL